MYVTTLDEFVVEAERLFTADPANTRYSIKFRHCDAQVVLKVTDNRTVISYKTKELSDVKLMEKLNNAFLHHFTEISPEAVAMELDERQKQQEKQQLAAQQKKQQQQQAQQQKKGKGKK
jgi:signal recognition particle subunit SRP9